MKIHLSAVEKGLSDKMIDAILQTEKKLLYNLMSYYYIKGDMGGVVERIRDVSESILIDSGAHSFQFGKKVNWEEYTKKYAEFIKSFDRDNVIGYFEMDIENIIGYDNVKELRKILEKVSDKIIPVWHPPRGIQDFKDMCEQYAGKIIAIGGFKGTDIKDEQYLMFIKYAKKYGCRIHCLGMTRADLLDRIPFDYTDSSSWITSANLGRRYLKMRQSGTATFRRAKSPSDGEMKRLANYKSAMQSQKHYHEKWQKECQD